MNGIEHYINDLNTRFQRLLYPNNKRNLIGLSFLNVRDGIPCYRVGSSYKDALFNDSYDITIFYIENGDRTNLKVGFQASIDVIICAKVTKISGINEEDIINEVFEIMKVTPFGTGLQSIIRGYDALEGFEYSEKIKETIYPYFVVRFKTKLTGILKQ